MTKKLWGGRFAKKTDPLVEEFTKSIHYDYKLAKCDIFGSMVHVQILKKARYLTNEEAAKLTDALNSINENFSNNPSNFDHASEDIHTDIQNKLQKKVGDLASKLHTARSRNDQVAFATKLCSKLKIAQICREIEEVAHTLSSLGNKYKNVIMPGFTHLQHAQPVYLKDYLGAYVHMLDRDRVRLGGVSDNMKISLGAGALAGTPINADAYNINQSDLPKEFASLGVELKIEPTRNSLDAVSDRDFVIDILNGLAILGVHLSRFAEDIIIWSTKEFNFVDIDEAFCTGSSLMPQKKNPDVLELVRGYSGRLLGNLVSVVAVMKALPLAYDRDMQLDKEPLFNSYEIVSAELEVLNGLIKTLKFNEKAIAEQAKDESLYATDLVYYLVDKKVPFKDAHTIVGKLVKHSIDKGVLIKEMPESDLKGFSDKFVKKEIVKLFDPETSVKAKRSVRR